MNLPKSNLVGLTRKIKNRRKMKIKLQYIMINFNDNQLQKNTPLNNFIRTSTEVVRNWTSNTPFFLTFFLCFRTDSRKGCKLDYE